MALTRTRLDLNWETDVLFSLGKLGKLLSKYIFCFASFSIIFMLESNIFVRLPNLEDHKYNRYPIKRRAISICTRLKYFKIIFRI